MNRFFYLATTITLCLLSFNGSAIETQSAKPKTTVGIAGEKFLINGEPTYKGRTWQGYPVEGLLMNSRMVQGIF